MVSKCGLEDIFIAEMTYAKWSGDKIEDGVIPIGGIQPFWKDESFLYRCRPLHETRAAEDSQVFDTLKFSPC